MKQEKRIIIILLCLVVIETIVIFSLIASKPKKARVITLPSKGKIAIVLDDWGYHENSLSIISQIKYPITMSVLPNLAYSAPVAKKLHEMGFEVILHLPMQPQETTSLEKDTLLASMDEEQISYIIARDLADLIYAKGVSNHMGSLLTTDRRVMSIIFKLLKKKQLFFLDSVVIPNSICSKLARSMGVKFAKRDIFLDNKDDPVYIMAQINKLKSKAKFYGQAIGIGHDRKNTLAVLKEALPKLAQDGYKLVFVSELIR